MPEITLDGILRIIMLLPVFVPAIVIHEYAHAWMAYRCGDATAKDEGRLTLDPTVHFEFWGSLMFVLSALTGYGFGWAKPVPVRFANLRNPLKDMVKVAAAGPATNLLQALLWCVVLLLLRLILGPSVIVEYLKISVTGVPDNVASFFVWVSIHGVLTNLLLVVFNLIPIPPLDGGRIVVGLLPYAQARFVAQLEPMGPLIVFLMLGLGVLSRLFEPIHRWGWRIIQWLILFR